MLDSVLIDSGASCNLPDYNTWNNMKQNRIECESEVSDKKLFCVRTEGTARGRRNICGRGGM